MPDNYAEFKGSENHFCVFCQQLHSSYPVLIYSGRGDTKDAKHSGTYACVDCAIDVKTMEQTQLTGPSSRMSAPIEFEAPSKSVRMMDYMEYGRFDETVHHHYQHVEPDIAHLWGHCYFCKQTTSIDYQLLDVPVDLSEADFNGGTVRCCPACKVEMEHSCTAEYPSMRFHQKHGKKNCFKCANMYYVTQAEQQSRLGTPLEYAYLCPYCTYIQYHTLPTRSHFYSERGGRFVYKPCEFCRVDETIDHCIDEEVLTKYHISPQDRFACTRCKLEDRFPIGSLMLTKFIFQLVYNGGSKNEYLFRIRSTIFGEGAEDLRSYTKTGNLIDVVAISYRDELLYNNGQTKLFEDP